MRFMKIGSGEIKSYIGNVKKKLVFVAIFTSLILTGCGTQNSEPPSLVRNFSYQIEEQSINFTWNSPKSNFNYIEDEYGDPTTGFDIAIEGLSEPSDFTVNAEKEKDSYKYSISMDRIRTKDSRLKFSIGAYNGFNGFTSSAEKVAISEFLIEIPKATQAPRFLDKTAFKWDQKSTSLTVSNFLEHNLSNRAGLVEIQVTGLVNAKYISSEYKGYNSLYLSFPNKFQTKGGWVNYVITASNDIGSTEFRGRNYIFPINRTESNEGAPSPAPTLVDPWTRSFRDRKTEEVAKLVWCLQNGYRNYDYSQDECTNRIAPRS